MAILSGCSSELPPEVKRARADFEVGSNHPIQFPHISGSFGEYRSGGRFHHGLDYKTFNRNGIPILAVEDMTAARLYTSDIGYGNGLVLASPDGKHFTYGHMHDFLGQHPQLEYLRMALYLMHPSNRASVNLPAYFSFKKGQTIGRSGESGSGAPHLHFEVGSGGFYRNPLEDPDRRIKDFSAPTLLNLHTRIRSFPAESIHRQYTRDGHTIDVYALKSRKPLSSADFRIGTYDTMAALNRNGVHGIRLYFLGRMGLEPYVRSMPEKIKEDPIYKMELDGIATSELRTADRYYDPEKTSIGNEYVYYLYDTLRRNRPELQSGLYLVEVLDSSGNSGRLLFEVGESSQADLKSDEPERKQHAPNTEEEDPLLKESDVSFRNLQPYAGASFHYSGQGMSLTVQIPGGSQRGEAKARILEPGWIRAMPPAGDGLAFSGEEVRAFVFDARDLVVSGYMYISGQIEKKYPDEELYLWNPVTGKWDWVGKPYRETETLAYYNLRLKRGGIFAIIRDVGRPVIFPALAWQRPEEDLVSHTPAVSKKEGDDSAAGPVIILREYDIYDQESWVDRDTTQVFLDGVPLPWEWAGDRSLLRIRVPVELMQEKGSYLTIQVSDLAGNPAQPFFDFVQP
ncbi:MAG: M23 family metallopeptidase [Leptospiraceae bacterium]|nr:M23 family metallopeptidase [Leptospiraceae bacterium]